MCNITVMDPLSCGRVAVFDGVDMCLDDCVCVCVCVSVCMNGQHHGNALDPYTTCFVCVQVSFVCQ